MTGLLNRENIRLRLMDALKLAHRPNTTQFVYVITFDIDNFKKINDSVGHLVGDKVIKTFAGILKRFVRRIGDYVGRPGGEEFLVVLGNSTEEVAVLTAENIREAVHSTVIKIKNQEAIRFTVSMGIAGYPILADDTDQEPSDWNVSAIVDDVQDRADKALYYSKGHGKDRATVWSKKMGPDDSIFVIK